MIFIASPPHRPTAPVGATRGSRCFVHRSPYAPAHRESRACLPSPHGRGAADEGGCTPWIHAWRRFCSSPRHELVRHPILRMRCIVEPDELHQLVIRDHGHHDACPSDRALGDAVHVRQVLQEEFALDCPRISSSMRRCCVVRCSLHERIAVAFQPLPRQ